MAGTTRDRAPSAHASETLVSDARTLVRSEDATAVDAKTVVRVDGATAVDARTLVRSDGATQVMLPEAVASTPPHVVVRDGDTALPGAEAQGARYDARDVLGAGGMGEVRRLFDRHIGRDIARKTMHAAIAADPSLRDRFLREARVQGQLEHPAVVPVYDLGVNEAGEAWFTMKRVRGISLDNVLVGLAAGDPELSARYGRRRLLSAFSQLCLAVDYAHSRGVIHRDLKPANVMLGQFGEVHVLDWGVAKINGEGDGLGPASASASAVASSPAASGPATAVGSVVGTPGYMSPEQARGDVDRLDARSDVYSLGAILFEILCLSALHPAPMAEARLATTLLGQGGRPSDRAEDVPPELDAICARAIATAPVDRYDSARALSEAIESFLDGDRDMERRRALSAEHTGRAEQALARAATDPKARSEAMHQVGRALAIEPANPTALRLLARLLAELPREVPEEALAELRPARTARRVDSLRGLALRYATWLLMVPLLMAAGVTNWRLSGALIAAIASCQVTAIVLQRRALASDRALLSLAAISSLTICGMSLVAGPFILLPPIAATNSMFFAMHAGPALRRKIMLLCALSVVTPVALATAGVLPLYQFVDDALVIHSAIVRLSGTTTVAALVLAHLALVVTPSMLVGRLRDELELAEDRVHVQAWNLRQLLPRDEPA